MNKPLNGLRVHSFQALHELGAHCAHALHQLASRIGMPFLQIYVHGDNAVFQLFVSTAARQGFSGQLVKPAAERARPGGSVMPGGAETFAAGAA